MALAQTANAGLVADGWAENSLALKRIAGRLAALSVLKAFYSGSGRNLVRIP
jgi:hypothetical protein